MTSDQELIPSEVIVDGQLVEVEDDGPRALAPVQQRQVVNPLDIDTKEFGAELARRRDNFELLRTHLREQLVPHVDFGKIHVFKKCDNKYSCTNPFHFSGWKLLYPGAKKILNFFGCVGDFVGPEHYRKMLLHGRLTEQTVISVTCYIRNSGGAVVSQGDGACALRDRGHNFNNAMKMAKKSAMVEAVEVLPGVSSLFDDPEYFDSIPPSSEQRQNTPPPAPSHAARDRGAYGRGAPSGKTQEFIPRGKHKGKRWSDQTVPTGYIRWVVENWKNDPDAWNAAKTEVERRALQDDSATQPPVETEDTTNQSMDPPPSSRNEGDPPPDAYEGFA